MNTEYKGKAPMELMEEEQLLKEFEDIMININEYYEAVDENIEIIEEILLIFELILDKVKRSLLISIEL